MGGCLAVLTEDPVTAVRAFASAQQVSASPSGTDEPIEADLAARLAQARTALGEDRFQREWELGRTLPATSVRSKVDALAAQPAAPGS